MGTWEDITGLNAGVVAELYARYRHDPGSVDEAARAFFQHWAPPLDGPASSQANLGAAVGAANLAHAIRAYGHLAAQIDPLGRPRPGDPSLDLGAHGVAEETLRRLPAQLVGGPVAGRAANALDAIQELRRVYTSSIGYDYGHIRAPEERAWLRDAAEAGQFRPPNAPIDGRAVLERLTRVETFERFLHRVFPGRTRFSIEGLDMLVPMLDVAIRAAAEEGGREVLLGMAHRGRINVLAHVLEKPYAAILAEFKDPLRSRHFRDDLGWTGDVTYHKGARLLPRGGEDAVGVIVTLAPNPSHVEAANPIVTGMARAVATHIDRAGPPQFDPRTELAILIHGDAAFPGQGTVAETLNLSRLRCYTIGGALHIIANNQLGYTTEPADAYSTTYASDLAKGFEIPLVHVNADDPDACLETVRLAVAYRRRFQKDFLIDLVGYRRYGHNEGDEPSFTQPVMYQAIAAHPTVRELWAHALVNRHVIEEDWATGLVRQQMAHLEGVLASLRPETALDESPPAPPPAGAARSVHTAVPAERLRDLHRALLQVPPGFALHPKLARTMERRRGALNDPDQASVDWGTAEQLALASILADGIPIRLTGQDSERGTFSQRHAAFYDVHTGMRFVPLQVLPQARAAFEVCNSPLTENAALGFEYGYNIKEPGRLVIWEAQYGDFINGAQVVVDEFVTSARAKWGQTPSLVLLLPHGAEGQGPDHSSGRLERFLELAAETNIRIANCTTAGQYFHLLRRQASLLETDPLPLVAMTPKSLLRHPLAAARLRDLTDEGWRPVIDDAAARSHADQVRRLILLSGKIAIDLMELQQREGRADVAIVRLEQLYPFPTDEVGAVLRGYPDLRGIAWIQEEPRNMGAWSYVSPLLTELVGGRWPIRSISRPPNASPAEGSHARHVFTQAVLLEQAFALDAPVKEKGALVIRDGGGP